jgi:hypothetical protein
MRGAGDGVKQPAQQKARATLWPVSRSVPNDLQTYVGLLGLGIIFAFDRAFKILYGAINLLERRSNFLQNQKGCRSPRTSFARQFCTRIKAFFDFGQCELYGFEK